MREAEKRGIKKSEILRRRELFKRVALTGKRLDGKLLRCTYLIHDEGDSVWQVAFKVSSKDYNAVRRNRIRRLMREAVRAERSALDAALKTSSSRVGFMVFFKGTKSVDVRRISLAEIRKDVETFCKKISQAVNPSS